jgi:phenylacetate-CoA ligase
MHPFIAKNLVYYPVQRLRKQDAGKYLLPAEKIQYCSLEEITTKRDEKLRKLVQHAYDQIPFYKEIFDTRNLKPADVSSYEDLQKLPVLSKRIVLANERNLITPNFPSKLYTRKTGGSTGMTLHFMKDARALALNDAIMWRCYKWYNIGVGDKQVRFWGVPVTAKVRWKEQLKDFVLNRIRISAFDISEKSCLEQYKRIKRFKPAYFYGYTTAIYGFCLFMKKMGIDLNSLNLKAVICTAEKMYSHHEELFKEVFDCPVVDEYGSSENGIIAFQCTQGNMHIMSDHLCVEFLDENDKQVKNGELGRVVITDLESYAMPLVRYDIGDYGRSTDRKCSCGVNLPLMEIVEGRKEDFIKTKDGKMIHAAYLCYTLKEDSVHEFKMYQQSIESLLVQIVKSPSFNDNTQGKLENNLRTALGDDMAIKFEYLERIPREKSGKLRYFVSNINEK